LPQVKPIFAKYEQIQSAMLVVAQYWSDDAQDAVHYRLVLSVLSTPSFPIKLEGCYCDPVNLPDLPSHHEILSSVYDKRLVIEEDNSYWYENGIAIPAFSAFCKEDCHQDMENLDAYSPYAILRRKLTAKDGIEIEVVGEMLRPWLDGLRPDDWVD
jgi:hypothetical protein